MPALLDAFLAGGQAGTRDREIRHANQRRSKLADLMSQGISAPQEQRTGLLSQMAAVDPDAAMSAQKHFGAIDGDRRKRLGEFASVFNALPDEQKATAYPQFAAQAREVLGVPIPDQWDPTFGPRIAQIGQALGSGQQELAPRVVGNALVDASGKVLYQGEAPAANGQIIQVPDGNGGFQQMIFDPKTRSISKPQYPGQASAPDTAATVMGDAYQGSLLDSVQGIVTPLGGRITSTTGGQHNPGSKHYSGNAIDVGMGRESPEQQAQILAGLQANPNLLVRDERTRPPGQKVWSGPHLHVEPRGGVAQAGRMGYTPPKAPAKTQSDVERRIALAREMGASEDEIRRLVLGSAAPKPPAAAKDAGKISQKLPQLNNAVRGVDRIGKALSKLDGGMLNTGPLDQYAQKYTKEGQELEAAVGAIQNSILALTRVPGVGSQSDLEQRVAMLQYPSLDKAPEVNKRTLENLKLFMQDLQAAYDSATSGQKAPAKAGGVLKWNPATGDFE
jgi:hypothetical protein